MATMQPSDGAKVYLKAIIFNICVQIFAVIAVTIVGLSKVSSTTQSIVDWTCNALLQVAFLSAILTTTIPKKRKLAIGIKRVDALSVVLAFITGIASVFCFAYLAQWPMFLLDYIGFEVNAVNLDGTLNLALGFLIAGISAPICEELVFRGSFFGATLKKGSVVKAVILSSVCFSLMHMNPAQTVYQAIVGATASIFAYYSGSVITAIAFHMASNLTVLGVSMLATSGGGTVQPSLAYFGLTAIMAILGVAVIFGVTMAIRALNKNRGGKVMLEQLLNEQKLDDEYVKNGEVTNAPLFGNKSHALSTAIALSICVLMWLVVLVASI